MLAPRSLQCPTSASRAVAAAQHFPPSFRVYLTKACIQRTSTRSSCLCTFPVLPDWRYAHQPASFELDKLRWLLMDLNLGQLLSNFPCLLLLMDLMICLFDGVDALRQ